MSATCRLTLKEEAEAYRGMGKSDVDGAVMMRSRWITALKDSQKRSEAASFRSSVSLSSEMSKMGQVMPNTATASFEEEAFGASIGCIKWQLQPPTNHHRQLLLSTHTHT